MGLKNYASPASMSMLHQQQQHHHMSHLANTNHLGAGSCSETTGAGSRSSQSSLGMSGGLNGGDVRSHLLQQSNGSKCQQASGGHKLRLHHKHHNGSRVVHAVDVEENNDCIDEDAVLELDRVGNVIGVNHTSNTGNLLRANRHNVASAIVYDDADEDDDDDGDEDEDENQNGRNRDDDEQGVLSADETNYGGGVEHLSNNRGAQSYCDGEGFRDTNELTINNDTTTAFMNGDESLSGRSNRLRVYSSAHGNTSMAHLAPASGNIRRPVSTTSANNGQHHNHHHHHHHRHSRRHSHHHNSNANVNHALTQQVNNNNNNNTSGQHQRLVSSSTSSTSTHSSRASLPSDDNNSLDRLAYGSQWIGPKQSNN